MQPHGSSSLAYRGRVAISDGDGVWGSSDAHSTSLMWCTSAGRQHGVRGMGGVGDRDFFMGMGMGAAVDVDVDVDVDDDDGAVSMMMLPWFMGEGGWALLAFLNHAAASSFSFNCHSKLVDLPRVCRYP